MNTTHNDNEIKEEKQDVGAAYTKEQLLSSSRYTNRRDMLSALLEDGKLYSHNDVKTIISRFMKGKVK